MTNAALPSSATVAVIGAGTMGSGIALVAARAGHPVLLHDASPSALEAGIDRLRQLLDGQVRKGKLAADARDAQLALITPAPDVTALAPAKLVIEAIVENLDVKVKVFGAVEAVTDIDTILATNTSSLSVTALAARMTRPERVVGMHFFNPAPVLPLVEVVSGHATDPSVADTVVETALAWGKDPVRCRSTPGFIVNRVARPFYGEGLRLLTENVADPATVDAVLRECGGFRMGPFELMDLIGHDVNFAVTRSVFEATFMDARFKPSLAQGVLVEAGWLGRKSGRGFYDYRPDASKPEPRTAPETGKPTEILVPPASGPAKALVDLVREKGLATGDSPHPDAFVVDGTVVALTDGRTAGDRAEDSGPLAVFDLALDYRKARRVAVALSDGSSDADLQAVCGLFQALGLAVSVVDDAPGLVVARTVAMLVNEASDALQQDLASAADIDLSMVKGVNYPVGPLAWADAVGPDYFATVVAHLSAAYAEDRYRPSPLLRRKARAGATFHARG